MSTPVADPRRRGFTLLEILISMSLFTLIGLAVVSLMRSGVDMWIAGNRGSAQEDRLEQSLPRLQADLRAVRVPKQHDRIPFDPKNPDPQEEPDPLPPENRFISGYHEIKLGAREEPYLCPYLAFVRDITGLDELDTYAARAGTNPAAESYIDGKEDEEEFQRNDHLPTGGAVEILWIWLPDLRRPGLGTVYRAYRTPVGGAGTLLDPTNHDDLAEIEEKIRPEPMFQDVLRFDVLFWTQYTTSWEGDVTVTSRPTKPTDGKERTRSGPSRAWDSTRGLLPENGPSAFKLGRKSLRNAADDIWPRMVRVQFALMEEQTELLETIGNTASEFLVSEASFATGYGELDGRAMKVGPEWIRVAYRDGNRRNLFHVLERGVFGTPAVAHGAGAPVYYGRVFEFTIHCPSFRDDNN